MNGPVPKIIFCFESPKTALNLPSAYSFLLQLKEQGQLDIEWLPIMSLRWLAGDGECRAIVLRPMWGGKLTREDVKRLLAHSTAEHPLFICTLSSSKSLIAEDLREGEPRCKVIDGKGGNADATAELMLWHAISLRRQLHVELRQLCRGVWPRNRARVIGSLQGIRWTMLGDGCIPQSLLKMLPGLGVKSVIVWKPHSAKLAFSETSIPALFRSGGWKQDEIPALRLPVTLAAGTLCRQRPDTDFLLTLTTDRDFALSQADVVSLHLELTEHDKNGRSPTKHSISEAELCCLHKNVVFINGARAEIVHPSVCCGEPFADSRHFSTDVFPESVEGRDWGSLAESYETTTDKSAACKLWKKVMQEEQPRLLITAHAGGATPDAEDRVAAKVFKDLIRLILVNVAMRTVVEFKDGREVTRIELAADPPQ